MHLFQINQTNKVHQTLAVLLVLKLQTQQPKHKELNISSKHNTIK